MTLREATHDLYEKLTSGGNDFPKWLACIGECDLSPYNDRARISMFLVREPMHHEWTIPAEWQGFPIEWRVTGPMAVMGGDPDA